MKTALAWVFALGWLLPAVGAAAPMPASDPSLHPLSQPIAPGEIQFTLRAAAVPGESFGVEYVYRPYRERDVKKTRSLGLFSGWIGGRSPGLFKVQRETFHSVRQSLTATGSNLTFTVSLRAPAPDQAAYQLETVRIVGQRVGTLEFERWFSSAPALDPGFGLKCEPATLRGTLRPTGLGAQPLRGSLPLWPSLRAVDLQFAPATVPVLQLFDAGKKHHWDGWRQTTPQFWPGGRTIVARHVAQPTLWREHSYDAIAGSQAPLLEKPAPPADVRPGVQLEVFWPEGATLELPETRFKAEGDVDVMAAPLSSLPPRVGEILAESVRPRAGWELSSLSAEAWREIDQLWPEGKRPFSVELTEKGDGPSTARITRGTGFNMPWLCLFATPYDGERRVIVTSLLLRPERWTGPLPE